MASSVTPLASLPSRPAHSDTANWCYNLHIPLAVLSACPSSLGRAELPNPFPRLRQFMVKKRKKLPGVVEKVIKPVFPNDPEKAQIAVEGADDLYREIRIENVVTDEHGEKGRLRPGAHVDVIVEADS